MAMYAWPSTTLAWNSDPYLFSMLTMCLRASRSSGKERDAESGQDYFGARYYSSNMGRWMSPDVAGPDLSNPQTLNKYRYGLNNPLRYTDPNGVYEIDVHLDLTTALAYAAGYSYS